MLIFSGHSFAQKKERKSDYLSRVPELQETARKASGGALGCGEGLIILVTGSGEIQIGVGLDPIHVFGGRIVVKDLLTLLEARAESNHTGKTNPMSGEVGSLAYVILSTLGESKDATVIPVIAELLDDKDDVIRRRSVIALFRLAESDEKLLTEIREIAFPRELVQSGNSGAELPTWVKIRE